MAEKRAIQSKKIDWFESCSGATNPLVAGSSRRRREQVVPPLHFLSELPRTVRRAQNAPAGQEGGCTPMRRPSQVWLPILVVCLISAAASAQVYQGGGSFRTQCPTATLRHPGGSFTGGTGTVVTPHPESAEALYTGPQVRTVTKDPSQQYTFNPPLTLTDNGGAIKCQEISGGDGFMTEADGNQTFMFAFGPLSGLQDIENGYLNDTLSGGTQFPVHFDNPYCDPLRPNYNSGQPNPYYNTATNSCLPGTDPNGAVGYQPPAGWNPNAQGSGATGTVAAVGANGAVTSITLSSGGTGYPAPICNADTGACMGQPLAANATSGHGVGAQADVTGINTTTGAITTIAVTNGGAGYAAGDAVAFSFALPYNYQAGADNAAIMNTGVINGNIPGPLFGMDEDDEFFLTLSNVGMLMRPDLFEQHTVHWHGYPNASSFYDGVPDATWAINIGGSVTYYYLAPDAGTYFWHCHITPPEHIQMGMAAWLFVRPRQNRTVPGTDVYQTSLAQQNDLRTGCFPGLPANGSGTTNQPGPQGPDILCSVPLPAADVGFVHQAGFKYVYNDGDGSTRYDVDVPLQIHGFDPNFHFVGMTFNPEGFSDMKDKYFLLNGRSYPDTIGVTPGETIDGNVLPASWTGGVTGAGSCVPGAVIPNSGPPNPNPCTHAISTAGTDTLSRPSQPAPAIVVLSASGGPAGTCGTGPTGVCGQRAALRIDDLDVQEYQTLSSPSIPMILVGFNAKILRDQAGNNQFVTSNSITLGGGESLDAIIDSTGVPPGTYFMYTPNLDHLSNDAENFGGLMTEIVVIP
jgi:hypothetical protein